MREVLPETRVILAVRDDDVIGSRVLAVDSSIFPHLRLALAMGIDVFPRTGIGV
jgi:hypothetical protein